MDKLLLTYLDIKNQYLQSKMYGGGKKKKKTKQHTAKPYIEPTIEPIVEPEIHHDSGIQRWNVKDTVWEQL